MDNEANKQLIDVLVEYCENTLPFEIIKIDSPDYLGENGNYFIINAKPDIITTIYRMVKDQVNPVIFGHYVYTKEKALECGLYKQLKNDIKNSV